MWQGQIAALSKHHKLVLWDMRGHGQSDYPDDPAAYSEALTVADMAALLDEVGADSAIVGGLSLGGYMSLAFYRAHPERVRALLIIDTGPGFKKDDARDAWNKRAHDTGDRFEREGLAVLKSASRERSDVSHRDASGLARAARGMLTQRDARVIERLPDIKVPSLVVVGADDAPFLAASDYMAAKIPGATESGDPGRRPRRQHRPAAGLHRRGVAVPRRLCRRVAKAPSHEIRCRTVLSIASGYGSLAPARAAFRPLGGRPHRPSPRHCRTLRRWRSGWMRKMPPARWGRRSITSAAVRAMKRVFLTFRNLGGSGLFTHNDRLYLQFRNGRLAGWKGDWGHNWMWQKAACADLHVQAKFFVPQLNRMDDPWDKISS